MGKKSTPSAPDPYQVAGAQAAVNKEAAIEQARLNRVGEVTPFGSVSYGQTGNPESPYFRQTVLNPAEQALLDSQRNTELKLSDLGGTILDRVSPQLATPFTMDGLPPPPTANDETRQRVEAALLERMDPYLQRDDEALRTRLANSGFDMNSAGYRSALDESTRAKNDARLAAIAQGGQEQSRLFGLEQAARQQGIQDRSVARSQPLNEIAAILGTGQVQVPQFGAVPQVGVAAPDITSGIYNKYNADVQNQSSRLGGLFGLAGTLGSAGIKAGLPAMLAASDRRLKTNIQRIGTWRGYPAYSWLYLWGEPGVGVMSDEVNQDAVVRVGGYDMVDYSRVR